MEEKVLRMMFQGERLEFMKAVTSGEFDWLEATGGFSKEGIRAFLDTVVWMKRNARLLSFICWVLS